MKNLYDKYYCICKNIYNLMIITDDEELKILSKNNIINIVNQLCEQDKNNRQLYQNILEEFGLKETSVEKESIKESEEILQIKNIKRTYNSKMKNKALCLIALTNLETYNSSLFLESVGLGAYYLYKNGIKSAKMLIEKNGFKLNENNELVDANNIIISEIELDKVKYNLIKKELYKTNDDGRIDYNYKKNKLTSMLLKVPGEIFKDFNKRYKKLK